jgi:hypothetical protein
MSRLRILFMLAAVLLFGSCSISAATYAVGTCKPTLPSFLSISAAVSSVPAGSTIEVCPGAENIATASSRVRSFNVRTGAQSGLPVWTENPAI